MHSIRRNTTGVSRERRTGIWRAHIPVDVPVAVAMVGMLMAMSPVQAAEFTCPSADVACLIKAINRANANGEANTIILEAGTYRLTERAPEAEGSNGFPAITSPLTITGSEVETTETVLERGATAPSFRLLYIAP